MESLKEKTVAEIVSENIKTAHIFKKYGIDFCCGGGVSVERACEKRQLDISVLEKELLNVDQPADTKLEYINWPLDKLVDHIQEVHHNYVGEAIPMILEYAKKVAKVHGAHYTEVIEIYALFKEVSLELRTHMRKEEAILFPWVKLLLKAEGEDNELPTPIFGTVHNPVRTMMMEHDSAGDVFKKIAELSNNYTPPEGACNTFKALYSKLQEFEEDLHLHIHLENNILFPKAVLLEKSVSFVE